MKRTLSHTQWIIITFFLVPCLVRPSRTLSIRVETDPSYHSSSQLRNPPSPFYIRHTGSSEVLPSQLQEDDKTDSRSYEYVDSDESGVTEHYLESATRPIPSIPPALRRHFARLTDNVQDSEVVEDQQKPTKKPKRRRKVKRPTKKSTTPKAAEDDLGIPENSEKGNSTGEKNLALEIGSDDGKYALINVFFDHSNDTAAPGILSYEPSDDFSKDNERTLGNLQQNDIWLSDGHLLILKGGDFDLNSKDRWKPIDAYERRKPTLKIPLDTNNPPPFPVFINDTGPPVFLGPPPPFGPFIPDFGSNETFDPSRLPPPGLIPLYPNGTIPEFFRPPPPGFGAGNYTFPPPFNFQRPGPPSQEGGVYGNRPPSGGLYGGGGPPGPGYGYGVNSPPANFNTSGLPPPIFFPQAGPQNNSRLPAFPFPFPPPGDRNGQPPGNGPQYPMLPPLVLNPNDNETDDPSIFLPPPYDFDYYEDNSTIVPPGPFAPGLVVPPPKDFYTVYNRTSPAYNSVPPTYATPFVIQDARSQRPNAKKPKFPITNPPDDSLEAAYPITSPSPVTTTAFGKKRKQRPGKTSKAYVNPLLTKYTKGDSSNEEVSAELPEDNVNDYKPVILVARPIPTTLPTTTTPKPPNYLYVRGKLKTLAEIAAEQAIEDAGVVVSHVATPPPPFDELGYPSRNIDDNSNSQPILFDFPRKTMPKVTTKPYIENTSKYTTNYNPNIYTKKKEKYPAVYPTTLTRPYSHGEQNLIQPSPTPIVYPEGPNQGHNNGGGIYFPDNYTRQKAGILRPTYFSPTLTPAHNGPPRTNFQPNQLRYQQNSVNRQHLPQQNLQNQNEVTNNEQSLIQRPNSGFRPAFPPPQLQQQIQRSRAQILFPGPTNQPSFSFNPLFQLPQNNGYYSPITQFRQPLDQNPFYPSQSAVPNSPGTNYNNINNNFNNGVPQFFQPQQFFPQQYQQQIQPSYNPAHANYIQQQQHQQPQLQSQQQQQPAAVPLHQDVLVNYREPLPQYNTESESITVRSVPKAGPAPSTLQLQYGPDHAGAGSNTAAVQSSGSFYSFQRGGPGGFSYKIRL